MAQPEAKVRKLRGQQCFDVLRLDGIMTTAAEDVDGKGPSVLLVQVLEEVDGAFLLAGFGEGLEGGDAEEAAGDVAGWFAGEGLGASGVLEAADEGVSGVDEDGTEEVYQE